MGLAGPFQGPHCNEAFVRSWRCGWVGQLHLACHAWTGTSAVRCMRGWGAVHVLHGPRFVRSMPCACLHVAQPCVLVGGLLTLKTGPGGTQLLWRDMDWVPGPA